MKLHQRTILITGGTSGIGLELARQLLSLGNTVIVSGRDQAKINSTRRTLPGIHVLQSDVSDPLAVADLHQDVLAKFPSLDVLVNNAGVMRNLNLVEPRDLTDLTREIAINLCGPIWMTQLFLPHLKTRPQAAIVNVSSGLAFVPLPSSPVYCAAKAGLHSFSLSLRAQLAGTRVAVVELAPPAVDTPLISGKFSHDVTTMRGMAVQLLAKRAIQGIEAGKLEIRPGLSNLLKIMNRVAPEFMLGRMIGIAKTAKWSSA
jgi:uncharacterized oxidoreductase